MTVIALHKTRFQAGTWEGTITGATARPDIYAVLNGSEDIEVQLDQGDDPRSWTISIDVPSTCLSDGVQTFVIEDRATATTLGSFAIAAGEALNDDLKAEVDLLRAELDMLKRAFRRHCRETS